MKKKYICPEAITVDIEVEGIIADSIQAKNQRPDGDDDENFFSNSYRNNLWN